MVVLRGLGAWMERVGVQSGHGKGLGRAAGREHGTHWSYWRRLCTIEGQG